MATHTRKVGDLEPPIRATLTDGAGAAQNLTGCAVTLRYRLAGESEAQERTATVLTPATAGRVEYAWQSGDITEAGSYDIEWVVTYPGGHAETYPNVGTGTMQVTERL